MTVFRLILCFIGVIAVGVLGGLALEQLAEPWIMAGLIAFLVVVFGLPLLIFGLK